MPIGNSYAAFQYNTGAYVVTFNHDMEKPINLESKTIQMGWQRPAGQPPYGEGIEFTIKTEQGNGQIAQLKGGDGSYFNPSSFYGNIDIVLRGEGKFKLSISVRNPNTGLAEVKKELTVEIKSNKKYEIVGSGEILADSSPSKYYITYGNDYDLSDVEEVSWSVSNNKIIEIEKSGGEYALVKPLNAGSAELKATLKLIVGTSKTISKTIRVKENLKAEIDKNFVCTDGSINAKVTGGIANNTQVTWSSPHLILDSEQGLRNVIFKTDGNYNGYTSIKVSTASSSKIFDNIWVGTPIANPDEKYTLTEREEITLKAKFEGINNKDYKWEILQGSCEIVYQKDDILTIKPTTSAGLEETIIAKATLSNSCGTATMLFNINVPALAGTSFIKPIYLGSLAILENPHNKRIDNIINIGDNGNELYYSFSTSSRYLLDKEEFEISILTRTVPHAEPITLSIYNSDKKLIEKRVSNGLLPELFKLPFKTNELSEELYYLVVQYESTQPISISVDYAEKDGASFFRAIPIHIESKNGKFQYTDIKDLFIGQYRNRISKFSAGAELFYRLELDEPTLIRVHTKGSQGVEKYLHIVKYHGMLPDEFYIETEKIEYLDSKVDIYQSPIENITKLSPGYLKSYHIEKNLAPGVYYVIVEGLRNGTSNTNIHHRAENGPMAVTIEAFLDLNEYYELKANINSSPELAELNDLKIGDKIQKTANTEEDGYFNIYSYLGFDRTVVPSMAKEVYHKIKLEEEMDIIIHHAGSQLQGTTINVIPMNDNYDLRTFYDSDKDMRSMNPIASNTGSYELKNSSTRPQDLSIGQAYLKIDRLTPGTYCIISEGVVSQYNSKLNGGITVNIEAKYPNSNTTLKTLNSSSTEQTNLKSIVITPNPASNIVDLIVNTEDSHLGGQYQIMKLTGGTVQKGILNGEKTTLNISNLSKGIYIVQVTINNKNYSDKLIVD